MRISRVYFRGFGRWVGRTFRFSNGINLIEAPNESGKSTLLQGLVAMLYGAKKEGVNKRQRTSWHERFQPWRGREYGGEIDFRIRDREYRLIRSLDWAEDREQLVDLKTGRDISEEFPFDARKDRRFAESLLGMSREVFQRVVFITSESLAGEKQVVERIRRLIAQGEETEIMPVINWLESEIQRIGKTPQARTKPYGMAVRDRDSLKRDVMEIRSLLQGLDRDKVRLGEMREELQALEEAQSEAAERLEVLHELLEMVRRRNYVALQAQTFREKLDSLAELEREMASLREKRKQEQPPHLLTREEWEALRKLAEERNEARRRLADNAERYRKTKEELSSLESDKSWLLELDEEELQRKLYRLEELLKKDEEAAQSAEEMENESKLRRMEEDCIALTELQEREDACRREKRRCDEEISFFSRQVEIQEKKQQRAQREKMLRESLDSLTPPGSTATPWMWMWLSGLALTAALYFFWPWGSLFTGAFSLFAVYRWVKQRAVDREALEKWEERKRSLEEELNKLRQEAEADGGGAEKWDAKQMLQDTRSYLEQLERELSKVLREQEAILRRWDAVSPLALYLKREQLQEKKWEAEWARSVREKNRTRLAEELRRELEMWNKSILEQLGPFHPEEWHASLARVLREAQQVKERARQLRAELDALRADSSRWEAIRADTLRRLQPWFERLGTDRYPEWEDWFLRSERVREMDGRLKEIAEKAARLKRLREEEEWDRRLEELEQEIEELEQHIFREEAENEVPDEEELRERVMQAEEEFKVLEEKCREQSEAVFRLSTEIHTRLDQIPPLADAETLLKEAEDRVTELEEERKALEIAKEELSEALRQVQEDIAPRLAPYASRWISKVTQGRYENLLLDPTDGIRLSVFVPETGERKEIEQLSQGTIDQMYFALRLAMIRLFSEAGNTPLPIILDDSLVHFDEGRLREALRILGELAGDHQILLCTCQTRERLLLEKEGIPFNRVHMAPSPQNAAYGS